MSKDQVNSKEVRHEANSEAEQAEDTPLVRAMYADKKTLKDYAPTAYTDEKQRQRKPMSSFETWTVRLAAVGILVAGLTGAAIYWQDRIASRTLGELQKQYPKLSESADAAQSSALTAAEALHSVQRAFLGYAPGQLDTNEAGDNAFMLGFWDNSGETPATKVWSRVHYYASTDKITKTFKFPFTPADTINKLVLGAHAQAGFSSGPIPKAQIHPFGPNGYFYGWVVYKDAFKDTPEHLTEFCVRLFMVAENVRPNAPVTVRPFQSYGCPAYSCFDEGCGNIEYNARIEDVHEYEAKQNPN